MRRPAGDALSFNSSQPPERAASDQDMCSQATLPVEDDMFYNLDDLNNHVLPVV
jgi:hypothetical protein